jgi:hypothetical protein
MLTMVDAAQYAGDAEEGWSLIVDYWPLFIDHSVVKPYSRDEWAGEIFDYAIIVSAKPHSRDE